MFVYMHNRTGDTKDLLEGHSMLKLDTLVTDLIRF